MLQRIDFNQIAPRNGSQADAFEEFCCQIARHTTHPPVGSEFIRYRGAGGDGGVESIWQLPSGEEWGWQVKYIFDLQQAKQALDDSISTALKVHPRLVRYTICLPFDLTGPTGRKGKSQQEKFNEYRDAWIASAQPTHPTLAIYLSTKTALLDALLSFDPEGGRLKFWFDATILSDSWFERHLTEVKSSAYPRYTPELRLETPIGGAFQAFGLTDEWFASLQSRAKTFQDIAENWAKAVASTHDSPWQAIFPDKLRPAGQQCSELLETLSREYQHIAVKRHLTYEVDTLRQKTLEVIASFRSIRAELAAELESKFGAGTADSVQFRQFQAEYEVRFPAANVDTAKNTIEFLQGFSDWIDSSELQIAQSSKLLVLGDAGVGKTHAICDIADIRSQQNLRTIVLFGERFAGNEEAWWQIRNKLGFDATISQGALLAMLDAAGEASSKPLFLCIDGLNETRPRVYWRNHLAALVSQIIPNYEWLRLCVSCRTTYKEQIIPASLDFPMVNHTGFLGLEFDACREFFSFYQLEPPTMPILQPEFSNPLFLRLICEAMTSAGLKRVPLGWHGISTAITAFLEAKNRVYAEQHDIQTSHRIPQRALQAFVEQASKLQRPFLYWQEAATIVQSVIAPLMIQKPLLDWLVHEGVLIQDAGTGTHSQESEDSVRIAFERLGDHLLATNLLSDLDQTSVQSAFQEDGVLSFSIADEDAFNENKGLLEALAVQIPERFGLELPDCAQDSPLLEQLQLIAISALLWRDSSSITVETSEFVKKALDTIKESSYLIFDVVLSKSTVPSHVDAYWLHELLSSTSIQDRDPFWCEYLHHGFEEHGPVEKLLKAAFQIDSKNLPQEIAIRWSIALVWFCASADRRIRDHATKALVKITEALPQLWIELLPTFIDIDDEYVIERCLLACYGTLIRSRNRQTESVVAQIIYDKVFKDSSRFQNALIRDHARLLIELAVDDGVLPANIPADAYLPPYQSNWPLAVPTQKTLDKYSVSEQPLWHLYDSCLQDDFFRYSLQSLDAYEHEIEYKEMGAWIFQEVLNFGYESEPFYRYDRYILNHFGGGRSRKKWAERIGKKYQWITLARLAARLADHIEPKRKSYEPTPHRKPLTFISGRDIDPSLLVDKALEESGIATWWFQAEYDFAATEHTSNEEWIAKYDDIPELETVLSGQTDKNGIDWINLGAYPKWSSKAEDAKFNDPYRNVWLNINSYLVPTDQFEGCWDWLSGKSFREDLLPQGARYEGGFVGEYPWATTFQIYDDVYYSRSYDDEAIPFSMTPTCNSLSTSYERDVFQSEPINFLLPARTFFSSGELNWNGVDTYLYRGRPCFLFPSIQEAGISSLLVNRDYLTNFLADHNMVLVWAIVGEKIDISPKDDTGNRLIYSRAHALHRGNLLSLPPIIEVE